MDHPQDQDPGNSTITFREERCSNQTHVSTTNPDQKLANKQNGTVPMVGNTVNGLIENRHQLILGINIESFRWTASERKGGRDLIDACHHQHARHSHGGRGQRVCYQAVPDGPLPAARPTAHCAQDHWIGTGPSTVRQMSRTTGYLLSQRRARRLKSSGGKRTDATDSIAFSGVGCGKSEMRPI